MPAHRVRVAVPVSALGDRARDLGGPRGGQYGGAVLQAVELEHAGGLRETVIAKLRRLAGKLRHEGVAAVAERLDVLVFRHRVSLRRKRPSHALRVALRRERLRRADPLEDPLTVGPLDEKRARVDGTAELPLNGEVPCRWLTSRSSSSAMSGLIRARASLP